MNNNQTVSDLLSKTYQNLDQDEYEIKIFEFSDNFSLQIKSDLDETLTLNNLKLDTSITTLVQKIRDQSQTAYPVPSDFYLELDSGITVYIDQNSCSASDTFRSHYINRFSQLKFKIQTITVIMPNQEKRYLSINGAKKISQVELKHKIETELRADNVFPQHFSIQIGNHF